MAKEDLKPIRSTEEAKARGRKGGVASGKARREKALLRSAAEAILPKRVEEKQYDAILTAMDVPQNERTYAMLAVIGVLKAAMDGNPAALDKIMKLVGEGQENVNHSGEINTKPDPLDALVNRYIAGEQDV